MNLGPAGRVGATAAGLCLLAFWTAPLWWALDPELADAGAIFAEASSAHPLGTDQEGRDVLARVLAGGRLASLVGFGVVFAAVGGGAALGLLAGWRGGWVDGVVSRVADVALAFPGLLLALLVLFVSERPGVLTVVLALSATGWASHARIVRGLVLAVRHRPVLRAARLYGCSERRLLWRFVVPAIAGPVAVQATFALAGAVLGEASLSFLGLGPQGAVSWGAMLSDGATLMLRSPVLLLATGGTLLLWQTGFILLADGLRDGLDPALRAGPTGALPERRGRAEGGRAR